MGLYLGGRTIQEVGGEMMMGLSIYGVAVIDGSLYSRSTVFITTFYAGMSFPFPFPISHLPFPISSFLLLGWPVLPYSSKFSWFKIFVKSLKITWLLIFMIKFLWWLHFIVNSAPPRAPTIHVDGCPFEIRKAGLEMPNRSRSAMKDSVISYFCPVFWCVLLIRASLSAFSALCCRLFGYLFGNAVVGRLNTRRRKLLGQRSLWIW